VEEMEEFEPRCVLNSGKLRLLTVIRWTEFEGALTIAVVEGFDGGVDGSVTREEGEEEADDEAELFVDLFFLPKSSEISTSSSSSPKQIKSHDALHSTVPRKE